MQNNIYTTIIYKNDVIEDKVLCIVYINKYLKTNPGIFIKTLFNVY